MTTFMTGYPPSTNRLWRRVGNLTLLSAEARAWKGATAKAALVGGCRRITGRVSVAIVLHPRTTKSGDASKVCIDVDGAIKITMDALEGVAYENDKQVKRVLCEEGEAIQDGGLTITVEAMT